MAIPATPRNVYLQQGNGSTLLSWDLATGATSYSVKRSTDGITYAVVTSPSVNYYLDSTVTVGTNYFYQVASVNSDGTSAYSTAQSIVPTNTGDLSLAQVRLMAQQRADRVGSNFLTVPEWNTNINQSYFELYDLLVTTYEDYYVKAPYTLTTTGVTQETLPSDFYKMVGVDLANASGYVTIKKFEFISRNKYVYPQIPTTLSGFLNIGYRVVGNTLMLIPAPAAGQTLRLWYVPKLTQLLQDSDILVGISGWSEYVIVDAAIKALQKEESDVSVLLMQKQALIKRIEESAMNRDVGQPDCISATRTSSDIWGDSYDFPNGGY